MLNVFENAESKHLANALGSAIMQSQHDSESDKKLEDRTKEGELWDHLQIQYTARIRNSLIAAIRLLSDQIDAIESLHNTLRSIRFALWILVVIAVSLMIRAWWH